MLMTDYCSSCLLNCCFCQSDDYVESSTVYCCGNDCASSNWQIVRVQKCLNPRTVGHHRLKRGSSSSSKSTSSSSSYLSSQLFRSSSIYFIRLFTIYLFSCIFLPELTMASPMRSLDRVDRSAPNKPSWVDPCALGDIDKVMNPSEEFKASIPKLDEKDLFQKIYSRSEVAKEQANIVKKDFVLKVFKDPSFEEDTTHMTYDWLPTLPTASLEHMRQLTRDKALTKSFEYLQYYAVGLEQVRIDQVLHSGDFLEEVTNMEAKMRQVLCELQISMLSLKVDQNPDVTRRVMSTRLRDMNSQTTRDFRDYIILREYSKGMDYIQQVFGFLLAKLL